MNEFCILLTVVFIVLKLIGIIQWSWLWVLSPLIFLIALIILFLGLIFIPYTIIVIKGR